MALTQTTDTLFTALANPHRRRILASLLAENPQPELSIPEEITQQSEEVTPLRVELYHHHLPLLEESGFIDWDRDSETVTRGPRFAAIRPSLEVIYTHREKLPDGWDRPDTQED